MLRVITQVFSINRNRYGALSILVTSISTIYKLCYWFDVELDNTVVVVIHDSLQPKRNRHASCSLHYPFLPLCLHSIYTRCNVHWRGRRDPWVLKTRQWCSCPRKAIGHVSIFLHVFWTNFKRALTAAGNFRPSQNKHFIRK